MRSVIRGENYDGLPVDLEISQGLQEITYTMIDPRDRSGKALRQVRQTLSRIMRVPIVIDGPLRGIDHFPRLSQPLDPTLDALSGGIGHRGQLQRRMRRIVGQEHEERTPGILLCLTDDQLLGLGRPQVGGVALIEAGRDFLIIFPDLLFTLVGLIIPEGPLIGGIMLVPVHVPDVAVEVIKAPLGRVAGPFLRGMPPAL